MLTLENLNSVGPLGMTISKMALGDVMQCSNLSLRFSLLTSESPDLGVKPTGIKSQLSLFQLCDLGKISSPL